MNCLKAINEFLLIYVKSWFPKWYLKNEMKGVSQLISNELMWDSFNNGETYN